ncbi:MAG: 16S rRNA (cytosine(1402)-N(4))-methyltransferase RsmH, partial [Deltaproteobacteria bacterium]
MTSSTYHVPVLEQACTDLLAGTPPGILVDGTLGGGGHTAALLARCGATHRFVGVDRDPDALAAARARFGDAPVTLLHGNFGELPELLARDLGPGTLVSGILLDLGVSSWQLDAPDRGFAIKHPEAPLDMRMNQGDADAPTALDLIETLELDALAQILGAYGEIRGAKTVARRLQEARADGRLHTSGDLAREVSAVQRFVGDRKGKVHPATRVFQALRIAVNEELEALDHILDVAADLLVDGGRLVVISYHSLEDRRVKHALRVGERGPALPHGMPLPANWLPSWRVLTRKPVEATAAEIAANPRARSARMRAAQRVARDDA